MDQPPDEARYEAEGEAAFEPRSRAPKTSPTATPPATVDLVLRLRKELSEAGLDAGADTIAWHLRHHHQITLSRATINRILVRAGQVSPDPSKRPKSSYIRFEAEQPNETWQSDFTHYRLTRTDGRPGADVEIISWLDDHSRYALHVSAHARITAPIVVTTFRETADQHGSPRPRSPTTAWSTPSASPARPPAAATPSKATPPPPHGPEELPTQTTPPPAARSSGSSRR